MTKSYDSICCFRSNDSSLKKRVCWELTTDCNLKCAFCHRYGNEPSLYNISGLDKTSLLLQEKGITDVIISGGEPLLHPDIFVIMERLKSKGFHVDLCSNATLINESMIPKLKDSLREISISIDGFSHVRHEKMRGVEGCFNQTVEAVHLLIKSGIEVHTTTVVDHLFVDKITVMTDFLVELGVKSMAFLGLIPINTGKNLLFQTDIQKKIVHQLDEARKKYPTIEINSKQLVFGASNCHCGAGKFVWGMDEKGDILHDCLLTRMRKDKDMSAPTLGLCNGSKYLTRKLVE